LNYRKILYPLSENSRLTLRDSKGDEHWLAVRHQQIAAVE
jgi:hypothetical protein